MTELEKFGSAERAGWADAATTATYFDHFAEPTGQTVEPVLDALGVGAQTTLLDVCCGQGLLTEAALARGATVSALDFSPAMLASARARAPAATYFEGDAQAMPFVDGAFDAVACILGVPHIPDTMAALREMRRVLRPGGRLALIDWCGPETSPVFKTVLSAIQAGATPEALAAMPPAPPMFRFADPVQATSLLSDAGFGNVDVSILDTTVSFPDPGDLFDMFRNGTVRVAMMLQANPPEALARIAEFMRSGFAEIAVTGGRGHQAHMRTALATATAA